MPELQDRAQFFGVVVTPPGARCRERAVDGGHEPRAHSARHLLGEPNKALSQRMTTADDQAERFLAALDPGADQFTFQTFDDNPERRERRKKNRDPFARVLHGSLASHWDTLVKLNTEGAGVYITVNATDLKGRSGANITPRVSAPASSIWMVRNFPTRRTCCRTSSLRPRANAGTCTGGSKDVPLDKFAATQKRLILHYRSDNTIHDLPRVMRLPGFYHRKAAPFLSRLVEIDDEPAYTLDELVAGLPDEPTPKERPASASSGGNTFWEQINAAAFDHRDAWVRVLCFRPRVITAAQTRFALRQPISVAASKKI